MDTRKWPRVEEIQSLPANHRRAVAATLASIHEPLKSLARDGSIHVPSELLSRLEELERAARDNDRQQHDSSLLTALQLRVESLEPARLGGYGPLSSDEEDILRRLMDSLREALDLLQKQTPKEQLSPGRMQESPGAVFHPIGVVHSPFKEQEGTPIQPRWGKASGRVELFEPFRECTRDLEGFERIWILSLLDRARPWAPQVIPYRDTVPRGLFSTRAPSRPNPIGLSSVRLLRVDGRTLEIGELDLLDGTPVLDIKPYSPRFDAYPEARSGWLDAGRNSQHADARFAPDDENEGES